MRDGDVPKFTQSGLKTMCPAPTGELPPAFFFLIKKKEKKRKAEASFIYFNFGYTPGHVES